MSFSSPVIPSYDLYGEQQAWSTAELLHWESVAERSRIHQWVIKPHRHEQLLQLIYVHAGKATIRLEGIAGSIEPPFLCFIPAGCVHGFEFSEDIQGHVVTMATALFEQFTKRPDLLPFLPASGELMPVNDAQLLALFEQIAAEYEAVNPHKEWALDLLINQLMLWVVRRRNQSVLRSTAASPGQRYLTQFQDLINQHYKKHWPLSRYAQQLKISIAHLNTVSRQFANQSALQLIHQRLLLEAKRNLIYTAMTISEISNDLGFSEPPYFTRFFKSRTGLSPKTFRIQGLDGKSHHTHGIGTILPVQQR